GPIARKLQDDHGAAFSGLVLLSPVLDFGWFSQPRHAPWVHAARLPSYVAAALDGRETPTREALREAELTRLDPAFVRRMGGRIEMNAFQHAAGAPGRVVSAYDTSVSGLDPEP